MPLHITSTEYVGDYKVAVSFNDGHKGVADLADVLTEPVFEALKDKTVFSQLKVDSELHTIVWPNGADLAPEFVYFKAFKDNPKLQEQFQQWGYIN